MDITEALNQQFQNENNAASLSMKQISECTNVKCDSFINNFNGYKAHISSCFCNYLEGSASCITDYNLRISEEELYAHNEDIYNKARQSLDNKRYYDAYLGFKSIPNHRDSNDLADASIQGCQSAYDVATDDLNNCLVDEAVALFSSILGYKDSKNIVDDIGSSGDEFINKVKIYNDSKVLMEAKDYYRAQDGFLSIIEYKDSSQLATECSHLVAAIYREAKIKIKNVQPDEALAMLKPLAGYSKFNECLIDEWEYSDVDKLINECESKVALYKKYKDAVAAMEEVSCFVDDDFEKWAPVYNKAYVELQPLSCQTEYKELAEKAAPQLKKCKDELDSVVLTAACEDDYENKLKMLALIPDYDGVKETIEKLQQNKPKKHKWWKR